MEIRQSVDGSSVLSGSPAELAEYILKLTEADSEPEPQDGRAFVGQVIPNGTKFLDMPPGVKVLDEGPGATPSRYRHTSEDGTQFVWSKYTRTPPPSSFDETGPGSTLWVNMTVREVW